MIEQFFCAANQARNSHDELIAYEHGIGLINQIDVSIEIEELRKKTWRVFIEALAGVFTSRRIEKICSCYHLDLTKFVQSIPPLPFLCRYLDLFVVGSAKIHEEDLVEEENDLHQKTPEELQILYKKADCLQRFKQVDFSENDRGMGQTFLQFFFTSKLSRDRKRMHYYRELTCPLAHRHGYLQRLTMKVIGFQPEKGEIIPTPDEQSTIDYYKVHRTVAEKGLYAVALLPISRLSRLPRLLLFRATRTQLHEIDCIHSWRNNMQKRMGRLGYTLAKDKLDLLMSDLIFCPKGEKITVASYSLGGAHAGYFCFDYWQCISEAVFFNTVSNEPIVAETLAQEINRLPQDQMGPSFYVYRAKGDLAHFLGGKHVGWGISHSKVRVEVQEFQIRKFPHSLDFRVLQVLEELHAYRELHAHQFLDHASDPYEKYAVEIFSEPMLIDKELDNAKREKDMERVRRSYRVRIAYHLLNIAYCLTIFAFRFFKQPYFKTRGR